MSAVSSLPYNHPWGRINQLVWPGLELGHAPPLASRATNMFPLPAPLLAVFLAFVEAVSADVSSLPLKNR